MTMIVLYFKQETAYEMLISDWSSDVCSSDLLSMMPIGCRTAPQVPGNLIAAAPSNGCIQTRRSMMLKPLIWACAAASLAISGAALSHDAAKPSDAQIAHIAYTAGRSEEHTSELQSLMRISYAVFCLKKKTNKHTTTIDNQHISNKVKQNNKQ